MRLLFTAILSIVALAQVVTDREASEKVRVLYEAGAWAQAAKLAENAQPRSADLEFYLGLSLIHISYTATGFRDSSGYRAGTV